MAMTMRETVMAAAVKEATAAAIKSHGTMYSTLYADRDGEASWGSEVDVHSRRRYEDGESVAVIWVGGAGCACNCEDCTNGIDPATWEEDCDGAVAYAIRHGVAGIYLGYFADEAGE